MLSSDLFTNSLDRHPLPPPAVKTLGPGGMTGLERSAPRRQDQAGRWSPRPLLHVVAYHAQHCESRSASGARRQPSLRSGQRLGLGKVGRYGWATDPEAGGIVDGNAGCDFCGTNQGQSPLSYSTLMPLTPEAIVAIGRALSNPG